MKIRLWGNSDPMSDKERKRLTKYILLNAGLPKDEPIEFVRATEKEIQSAAEKRLRRGSD